MDFVKAAFAALLVAILGYVAYILVTEWAGARGSTTGTAEEKEEKAAKQSSDTSTRKAKDAETKDAYRKERGAPAVSEATKARHASRQAQAAVDHEADYIASATLDVANPWEF